MLAQGRIIPLVPSSIYSSQLDENRLALFVCKQQKAPRARHSGIHLEPQHMECGGRKVINHIENWRVALAT